jgi:hypothetical protein
MGIFDSKEFATEGGEHFHHPSDLCFYCSEPLTGDNWIFWNGSTGQIWMHPECAKRLADNLNKDWERYRREHPQCQ